MAWGDGQGGFTLQAVRNITGSDRATSFAADLDGRDDIAFSTDPVQPEGPQMNIWFGAAGRTFRRETREPFPGRGGVEVHRSRDSDRADAPISDGHSGAASWTMFSQGSEATSVP